MRSTAAIETPIWVWVVFSALVIGMLSIDLVVHRGGKGSASRGKAYIWSAVWIGAGLLFTVFIRIQLGAQAAQEYLAAYLIEKSLSLDNLFVFLIIFQNLNIPDEYQHSVLFWGVLGALVFRALFIFLGVAALRHLDWVTYVFAAILLFAAYHAFREDPAKKQSRIVKWLSKHLPVTRRTDKLQFVANENGHLRATRFLIALIGLELSDIAFAVDSVPAALSVTRNLFVIYSSNALAVLGLRALYTALVHLIAELRYLHYGLAGVLAFAAVKLIIDDWVHIPAAVSVGVTISLIAAAILTSLHARKKSSTPP